MSIRFNVSLRCQYAIKAVLALSFRYPTGNVATVSGIADDEKIPFRFLEQIFSDLQAGGITNSKRGPKGGYRLNRAPSTLSVSDIVDLFEGREEHGEQKTFFHNPHSSSEVVLQELWDKTSLALSDVLDTTTFQDLVDKRNKLKRESDYQI